MKGLVLAENGCCSGVTLKDGNERESSQQAKFQAAHLVIHLEKRKKWPDIYSLVG